MCPKENQNYIITEDIEAKVTFVRQICYQYDYEDKKQTVPAMKKPSS